ncbi:unnamed protein product, partial [Adineta steineri]
IARDGGFRTKCLVITYGQDENDEAFLNEVKNCFKVETTEVVDEINQAT